MSPPAQASSPPNQPGDPNPNPADERDPSPPPSGRFAPTKSARQSRIVDLVTHRSIRSQSELAEQLAAEGFHVTQATLSRDLVELGAIKVRAASGDLVYAAPAEGVNRTPRPPQPSEHRAVRLRRLCEELLLTADACANLVVLRTPPGAAQFLASAVDHAQLDPVLGTIAGDDTVLVIARAADGGKALARRFLALAPGLPSADDDVGE